MDKIRVTVVEQPGRLGNAKARAIYAYLVSYYQEHKEEVDRKVRELNEGVQHESAEN